MILSKTKDKFVNMVMLRFVDAYCNHNLSCMDGKYCIVLLSFIKETDKT